MSITMIPQPTGMVLPRCSRCGRGTMCREVVSLHELSVRHEVIEVRPPRLGSELVGTGLRADDLTCSSCLAQRL